MQYFDKAYTVNIEIKYHENIPSYAATITYPCGEIVEKYDHFMSERNAVLYATNTINKLPEAVHNNCKSEKCQNNKYLIKPKE